MKKLNLSLLLLLCAITYSMAQKFAHIPGTVVCYQPASTQKYIGSPSLVILPNGDYVASHDLFGPQSFEWQQAKTYIYKSKNKVKS